MAPTTRAKIAPGAPGSEAGASLAMLPWFADAYIAASRHLTLAERGAYTDLLFFQWTIGPLPKDTARLASLIGATPREFAAVWPAIRGKFAETPAGLVNARLEAHRAKAAQLKERHRTGAEKTNRKRWGESLSESPSESPSDTVSESLSDEKVVAERVASNSNSNTEETYQGQGALKHQASPPLPSPSSPLGAAAAAGGRR